VAAVDPDLALRQAAVARARDLGHVYDDLVPLAQLQAGFEFEGARVSFGSFQKGIHRARVQRGPAALTLTTSLKDPYGDAYDQSGALFTYAYALASSTRPTTARCAPPSSCRHRSSTSAQWRRAST
jgi:hypothetical protein